MRRLVFIAVFLAMVLPAVFATELGVNYYHETLMTESGEKYIPRTIEQVGQDLDDIHAVSDNVKLFMNPFVDANAAWTEEVNALAKQKGFHTVVTMMVDKQTITAENWDDYANRVVSACQQFAGKADEIHVGNEITLHSPLPREDIKVRVIDLMNRCKTVYPGPVSYQEFWYAHNVWEGHTDRLYFMMYENFNEFQGNMVQLQQKFPNAAIGEWGEDQLEGTTLKDEAWQKDQIQQRWNIINNANIPIAYLFTYREPNPEAFGMVRPDGTHKPLWEVFGGVSHPPGSTPPPQTPTCTPTTEVADSVDNDCDGQVDEDIPPPVTNTGNNSTTNSTSSENNTTDNSTEPVVNNDDDTGSSGGGSRRSSSSGGGRGIRLDGEETYTRNNIALPTGTAEYDAELANAVQSGEVRVHVTLEPNAGNSIEAFSQVFSAYKPESLEVQSMTEDGFIADIDNDAFQRLIRDPRVASLREASALADTEASVETEAAEDETAPVTDEPAETAPAQEAPQTVPERGQARPFSSEEQQAPAPIAQERLAVEPELQRQGFFARIWNFFANLF